jgi:AbiV
MLLPFTKTELDSAMKKEVRPMGREYGECPPVDRTRLRDGYQMCLANARRLINDATMLREAGRFRTAYLILFVAVEELGKAMQLYEAGRSGVHNWKEWWSRYFSHPREQESASLEIVGTEVVGERFAQVREELMYVNFDEKDERFISPREDDDPELVKLFEQETARAEDIMKALPSYAFERLELEEMVQRSPEIVAPALYARIEEIVSREPGVSEKDLLTAIAHDLGMSMDDFAAGFERWKKVSPKARTYMDLLQRVQGRLRKERQQKEAEGTG